MICIFCSVIFAAVFERNLSRERKKSVLSAVLIEIMSLYLTFLNTRQIPELSFEWFYVPVSQRRPVNPEGQTHVLGDTQVPPLRQPSSQKAGKTNSNESVKSLSMSWMCCQASNHKRLWICAVRLCVKWHGMLRQKVLHGLPQKEVLENWGCFYFFCYFNGA